MKNNNNSIGSKSRFNKHLNSLKSINSGSSSQNKKANTPKNSRRNILGSENEEDKNSSIKEEKETNKISLIEKDLNISEKTIIEENSIFFRKTTLYKPPMNALQRQLTNDTDVDTL